MTAHSNLIVGHVHSFYDDESAKSRESCVSGRPGVIISVGSKLVGEIRNKQPHNLGVANVVRRTQDALTAFPRGRVLHETIPYSAKIPDELPEVTRVTVNSSTALTGAELVSFIVKLMNCGGMLPQPVVEILEFLLRERYRIRASSKSIDFRRGKLGLTCGCIPEPCDKRKTVTIVSEVPLKPPELIPGVSV